MKNNIFFADIKRNCEVKVLTEKDCRYLKVKFLKDKKGFTFIEIILVMAILIIFASTTVLYMGHLRDINVKKAANEVDTALDKLQVRAMSKAKTPYMYIYRLDDGCYMKVLNEEITLFDTSKFDKNGTKIGAAAIKIYQNDETTAGEVTGQKFITIVYNKSSDFSDKTNVSTIIFKGNSRHEIRLIKYTGKHILE